MRQHRNLLLLIAMIVILVVCTDIADYMGLHLKRSIVQKFPSQVSVVDPHTETRATRSKQKIDPDQSHDITSKMVKQPANELRLEKLIATTPSSKTQSRIPNIITSDVHQSRMKSIGRFCKEGMGDIGDSTGNTSSGFVTNQILLDVHLGITYCPIEKVGSSFMRAMLKQLKKIIKGHSNIPSLADVTQEMDFIQAYSLVSRSQRVMFVREPYGRLLSAYVDKFYTLNTLYWSFTTKYIYPNVRPPSERNTCGHDLTFAEFVQYILKAERAPGMKRDKHFTPMFEHCWPCQMSYNVIGKLETFRKDVETILNTLNVKHDMNFTYQDFNTEDNVKRASGIIKRTFYMMRGNAVKKCMSFEKVLKKTWRDLQIRGFILKSQEFPYQPNEINTLQVSNMTQRVATLMQECEKSPQLKQQKLEALIEAYSMVPTKDLMLLKEIFQTDCDMFDYNCHPDSVFISSRKLTSSKRKYFDL